MIKGAVASEKNVPPRNSAPKGARNIRGREDIGYPGI